MPDFSALRIEVVERVAWLTIDHPPINLFDGTLMSEMDRAGQWLAGEEDVHVVVIQSADADFFIAHADVELIQAAAEADPADDPPSSFFHAMTERFRAMPKPVIGKIDGIARGGGLELLAALDMRFCSLENTTLAQPEITLGIAPGGGGPSRWPRLIGTARAMELMLSGADIDGATAERYGMVNRALPRAELNGFVRALATRIAAFPPHAAGLIKAIGQHEGDLDDRLAAETDAFFTSARHPAARRAMRAFMERGGQTRDAEMANPF